MLYKTALEIASRIWCDQDYSYVIMNPELARKIAHLLMREELEQVNACQIQSRDDPYRHNPPLDYP